MRTHCRMLATAIAVFTLVATPLSSSFGAPQDLEPPPDFLGEWRVEGGPNAIAIDEQDILYVINRDYHDVRKYSRDGVFLGSWGSEGSGPGQFNWPNDITIGPDGLIYVAEGLNHRIQVLTRTGAFVRQWGTTGDGDGQFNHPYGVRVDASGKVFVVDYLNNRIQVFSPAGDFLYKWGSLGSGLGQFRNPLGIAIDSAGDVYVTDNTNYRIQKFTNGGAYVGSWSCGSNFSIPHGITIDANGNAYVVIRNNGVDRADKFDGNGTLIATWGSHGSLPGQFYDAEGIAIDRFGEIFVADKANWRVQKFGYLPTSVETTTWSRLKLSFSSVGPGNVPVSIGGRPAPH